MVKMNTQTKTTVLSALVLAIVSLGDTLLYPVLSSSYHIYDISLFWVGILLSVNRFVRLVANRLVGYAIMVLGLRRSSILAAGLAAATTIMYTLAGQVYWLLLARIGWGFAYATLRINAINTAVSGEKKGFLLGLSNSLYETGPLLALVAGPMLIGWAGVKTTFLLLGLVSFTGVYLALSLPQQHKVTQKARIARLKMPDNIEQIVFVIALFVEGALVVIIAPLLAETEVSAQELIALSAFYLIVRRLSSLILSPIAGKLADRLGVEKVFSVFMLSVVAGLLALAAGWIVFGIVTAFISSRMVANLAPAMAIKKNSRDSISWLASLTTWRDLGAALGALGGFTLLGVLGRQVLFLVPAVVIFIYGLKLNLKNEPG